MTKKSKHIISGRHRKTKKMKISGGDDDSNTTAQQSEQPTSVQGVTDAQGAQGVTGQPTTQPTIQPESPTKNYDNEYKVTLKVFPSTVENDDGKVTIGDIKIVYDSNHRINSTMDQVDYYLLELARYLKWLTNKDESDKTITIHKFLKNKDKSMSFIKNVPKESEIGEGDVSVADVDVVPVDVVPVADAMVVPDDVTFKGTIADNNTKKAAAPNTVYKYQVDEVGAKGGSKKKRSTSRRARKNVTKKCK